MSQLMSQSADASRKYVKMMIVTLWLHLCAYLLLLYWLVPVGSKHFTVSLSFAIVEIIAVLGLSVYLAKSRVPEFHSYGIVFLLLFLLVSLPSGLLVFIPLLMYRRQLNPKTQELE